MGYPGYSYGGTGTTALPPSGIAQPDQFTPDPYVVGKINAWRNRAYGPQAGGQTTGWRPRMGPFQPVVAENPQNQGLANAVNSMQSLNQQTAARGPVPYQAPMASPGQPAPSPYSPAMQQMVNRGLNNARFGNARESTLYDISHPGTGYRSPLEPTGGAVAQTQQSVNPAEFAKRQGLEFNPQTGVLAGNSPAANMTPGQLATMRVTGRSPYAPKASQSQLAQNLKNTQASRAIAAKDKASRPTPFQQRLAQRQTQFENQLAAAAPEQYQTRKGLEAQTQGINERSQYAADAKLRGDLAAAGMNEQQIASVMAQRSGGAAVTKTPLEAPKAADIAHLSPEELDIVLKDYPQATRDRIKSEMANKLNKPNFFRDWLGGAAGEAIGSAIGRKLDPYGLAAPWLGIKPPPLSRPTRGSRGVSGSW